MFLLVELKGYFIIGYYGSKKIGVVWFLLENWDKFWVFYGICN